MPPSGQFVHLHCHSEFSLLDGANRLNALVDRARELNMPALALTDHGVMYGVADFYSRCVEKSVQPILGMEAYVAPRSLRDKQAKRDQTAYHMVLLARNATGYKNLMKLASIAALQGFYYKPRVDRQALQRCSEGLIATSACLAGEVCSAILDGNIDRAREAIEFYRGVFGKENFYIELQDHRLPEQARCNPVLLQLASEFDLPVICSNDVHYLGAGDAEAHDVLLCIGTGSLVSDQDRLRYATQEFYLKTAEEMRGVFRECPEAVERTLEVASRCSVELEFGQGKLPTPGIPEGATPQEYLATLAEEGLARRYGGRAPDPVQHRLQYELDVIRQTGFAQYILIVRDFARFAQERGIFFGVRGSAAGSLTSYLVGITDIDPVEYGLTFERFLNPERVQMPDVDMDFEDARRSEVIDYVVQKYSPNQDDPEQARVAQIITFGTLGARAVLKDAGRALGVPLSDVERLCKMVPTLPVGVTIDQSLQRNAEFQSAYDRDSTARTLVDTARRLEGISRHASVHAAGVIISHDPLIEYTPLTRSAEGGCVTQYTASTLEKLGLLKMDFLGLINLSILAQAVKNVEVSTGRKLDVRRLPLDDPKTFELLASGACVGVFQLESAQMRRYIQELRPSHVRDVAAMVALYRPGPMAHIPRFIRCKHGLERIEYPHPLLKDLLEETYGVIVYQDQVMQIARVIAGYSLGQADLLRRAMGKKKKEEMAKQRAQFLEGARANEVQEKKASEIFDLMEPFAGYAFNKAHAVCYALVAYQTAYLKANYPVEYMAALLACSMDKSDRLATCLDECKRMGIPILGPDVNASAADFTVCTAEGEAHRQTGIRIGMAAVKNVGRSAVEAILKSRASGGPFQSLSDFCDRVMQEEGGSISKMALESLVQSGAFSSIAGHGNRKALMELVEPCVQRAARIERERKQGQGALFADGPKLAGGRLRPPDVPEYPREKLLAMERELLGLYLTEHPLQALVPEMSARSLTPVAELKGKPDREEVRVGGILTQVKAFTAKKSGEPMAFFTLEDMTGAVSCTMFPSIFAERGSKLVKDAVVEVRGRTSYRERVREDEEAGVIVEILADDVLPLGVTRPAGDRRVVIRIPPAQRMRIPQVRQAVEHHQGNGGALPVYVRVSEQGMVHDIRTELRAEPSDALRADLEKMLGRQSYWVE